MKKKLLVVVSLLMICFSQEETTASVWQNPGGLRQGASIESAVGNLIRSKGKIGPYKITFFWDSSEDRVGKEVGYYYYNDRPNTKFKLVLVKSETINIHGSMHVILKEYSPAGKHTGTFDGQYECRGGGYEGTFTNSKGQKYHFELMEE